MNAADMLELVKTLRRHTPTANLDAMIRAHQADRTGHCPLCRTVGCTLYTAAMDARYVGRARSAELP